MSRKESKETFWVEYHLKFQSNGSIIILSVLCLGSEQYKLSKVSGSEPGHSEEQVWTFCFHGVPLGEHIFKDVQFLLWKQSAVCFCVLINLMLKLREL